MACLQAVVYTPLDSSFVSSSQQLTTRLQGIAQLLRTNGDTLRQRQVCTTNDYPAEVAMSHELNSKCAEFRLAALTRRRVHRYFIGTPEHTSEGISLMTQLTLDRWPAFERFIVNWLGPIIAVFHGTDHDAVSLLESFRASKELQKRSNVVVHFVFEQQVRVLQV